MDFLLLLQPLQHVASSSGKWRAIARADLDTQVRYRVTGMDCSSCAAKIEGAARKIAGVQDARVLIASQGMTLRLATLPTCR